MSLDGSKHRKSSAHGKNEFMSVTVRKQDPSEKAGIKLQMEASGRIIVKEIAKNGLFADTEVAVGDIILSVNALRLKPGEDASIMADVIKNAKDKVTLVVKKPPQDGAAGADTALKRSSHHRASTINKPVENNNATTRKSYQTKACHNVDGSIRLGVDVDFKSTPVEQVTISATKETKSQQVKIDFVVEERKLFVSDIANDSIFADTRLEVGDRVLAINDMSFREFADAKYANILVKKAQQVVIIIVEKGKAPQALKSQVEAFQKAQQNGRPNGPTRSTSTTSSFATSSSDDGSLSSDEGSFGEDQEDDVVRDNVRTTQKRASKKITSMVTITVPKQHQHDRIGLKLIIADALGKKIRLVVDRIDADSIFVATSLELGDRILSINNKDYQRAPMPNEAMETMRLANEAISLIVEKSETTFAKANFDLDASVGNLVY